MESSIPVGVLILIAIILLGSSIAVYFAFRFIRRSQAYSGDPDKKEVASGYIESVRETNLFVNERPQLEFEITLFPPNDASRLIRVKQVAGFIELPLYQPGKYVMLSYEAGTYQHAYIDGAKPFEVTGAPFDPQYISDLTRQLTPNQSEKTTGKILQVSETGSWIDSLPLYRITTSFVTSDGTTTEADTLRVCRPWMAAQLRSGNRMNVIYNRQNPEIYSITE